jgi:hypothetical protein
VIADISGTRVTGFTTCYSSLTQPDAFRTDCPCPFGATASSTTHCSVSLTVRSGARQWNGRAYQVLHRSLSRLRCGKRRKNCRYPVVGWRLGRNSTRRLNGAGEQLFRWCIISPAPGLQNCGYAEDHNCSKHDTQQCPASRSHPGTKEEVAHSSPRKRTRFASSTGGASLQSPA